MEVQTAGRASSPPALFVRPAASPSPVALPLSVLAGRSGADVRVTLNLLLQEQLYLSAAAMDAARNARLDELIGVSGALDQNSILLAEVVGAVKGDAAARTQLENWRGLEADLIQYAQGRQSAASADLDRRTLIIAEQFALGGLLPAVVADLLRARVKTQLMLADAIVSHDAAQVAQRLRLAAATSDDLARPLAAAISAQVPTPAPAPTEGLDIDVRILLSRLLQEHTFLTGAAVDAAADGRSLDLEALVGAADENATDLGAQLTPAYGQPVGDGLTNRVRAETGWLVSVASGGDRPRAAADLVRNRSEVDAMLSAANPLLPAGLVDQELRASGQPLLTAADAFVARDFGTAFTRLRESARQSRKAAESVALSLVDRYPGRYLVLPSPER
ncbi:MAG: hypothetical protein ACR2IK_13915 [Chloroflexota bacterium]